MTAIEHVRLLSALVGTLIPGDGAWPAADIVGVQAMLASRLVEARGEAALDELCRSLESYPGLVDPREAGRVAAVTAFEDAQPALFKWVRDAAFLAYYECPLVVRAMNERGIVYRLRPHVGGYDLPAFDPAADRPTHGRGHWVPAS